MDRRLLPRQLSPFFIFFIFSFSILLQTRALDSHPQCADEEHQALLHLKQGLVDDYGYLSSWRMTESCCTWTGVTCNPRGRVTALNLHPTSTSSQSPLRGTISHSLTNLTLLHTLDLSSNNFDSTIPDFIGSITTLRRLNLSAAGFWGSVPSSFTKLLSLQHLDLSYNNGVSGGDLAWVAPLSALETLVLSFVDLSSALQWRQVVSKLHSLRELRLSQCSLPLQREFSAPPHPVGNGNGNGRRTTLSVLDLSQNDLSSIIYTWVFPFRNSLTILDLSTNSLEGVVPPDIASFPRLIHLDLSQNEFTGIPSISPFGGLCNLTSLSLAYNSFALGIHEVATAVLSGCIQKTLQMLDFTGNQVSGPVIDFRKFPSLRELYFANNLLNASFPRSFFLSPTTAVLDFTANMITGTLQNFSSLSFSSSVRKLYLGKNQISGNLDEGIGKMGALEDLILSSNKLEGRITEAHFFSLSKLRVLDLSSNSLTLSFDQAWVPPFQLEVIMLRQCALGPRFPAWLRTQKNYSKLDISLSGIDDGIPDWFGTLLPPTLHHLNLSWNRINGPLPNLLLEPTSNGFNEVSIDLSGNRFTGEIQQMFPPTTTLLNLSKNKLSGSVLFLCRQPWMLLRYLDLSDNHLSGGLPGCWDKNIGSLVVLHLENNNLNGTLPPSIAGLSSLESLHMRNNSFHGELPPSLKNCSNLKVVDIGDNSFTGDIKDWMGENMESLLVLSLRSNRFNGSISSNVCNFPCVQIVDLSQNKLSGTIPSCLGSLPALVGPTMQCNFILNSYATFDYYYRTRDWYIADFTRDDDVMVVWKRHAVEYRNVLARVKGIDLSSNTLTGGIPNLASLVELVSLNLSRNKLEGPIFGEIGHLVSLDSLDLSMNQLSGGVPPGLAKITTLSVLDLSGNNLSGMIPTGPQLQSFGASVYSGNNGLCGPPLPNSCTRRRHSGGKEDINTGGKEEGEGKWSLYVSVGLGFGFGFWAVCAPLLLSNSFSNAFFNLLIIACSCTRRAPAVTTATTTNSL